MGHHANVVEYLWQRWENCSQYEINSPRHSGDVIGHPNFFGYKRLLHVVHVKPTISMSRSHWRNYPHWKGAFNCGSKQRGDLPSAQGILKFLTSSDASRPFLVASDHGIENPQRIFRDLYLFARLICLKTLLSSDSTSENLENWLCRLVMGW